MNKNVYNWLFAFTPNNFKFIQGWAVEHEKKWTDKEKFLFKINPATVERKNEDRK